MKLCVVGVGGVGGYFGGKLAHACQNKPDAGHEVYFVARGDHLDMIKRKGLLLNTSDKGTLVCKPIVATDLFTDLPEIDVFIVGVKGYDLNGVSRSISTRMKKDTVILPLLNGVDIRERMRATIRKGSILPACAYVSAYIEAPGVVVQNGTPGRIILGLDPDTGQRPVALVDVFRGASIDCDFKEDAFPAIWEKYVFIASYGLVSARFDKTIGEIYENDQLRNLVRGVMEEICRIALAKKISLPADVVALSLEKAKLFTRDTQTSLQRDIRQRKKSELDLFGRTVVTLGMALNVPTPVTREIYDALLSRVSR